jgi:hypothetical protein
MYRRLRIPLRPYAEPLARDVQQLEPGGATTSPAFPVSRVGFELSKAATASQPIADICHLTRLFIHHRKCKCVRSVHRSPMTPRPALPPHVQTQTQPPRCPTTQARSGTPRRHPPFAALFYSERLGFKLLCVRIAQHMKHPRRDTLSPCSGSTSLASNFFFFKKKKKNLFFPSGGCLLLSAPGN